MSNLNCLHATRPAPGLTLIIVVLLSTLLSPRASEIVIDNREPIGSGFVSAPLVAIRPVTTNKNSVLLARTRISKDLIIRSATAFPEIQSKLKYLGISDPFAMRMSDFVSVIKDSDYADRYLYNSDLSYDTIRQYPVTMSSPGLSEPQPSTWDARTLTNMVVTGVVNTDTVFHSDVGGKEVEWFRLDEKYAHKVKKFIGDFQLLMRVCLHMILL